METTTCVKTSGARGDVLSERLESIGSVHRDCKPPLLKAVYIGGPSAVGKSTVMEKIEARYSWARVAKVNFRNLFSLYGGDADRAVHHLVYCRNESMIYEHTDDCPALYRIVHRYMRRTDVKAFTKEVVHSCYRDCVAALTEPSASTMIVMLDTTESFVRRYERRLKIDNNGIDYTDVRYLYFQVAAYMAFLTKRHLYPFMTVLIATDSRVFGESDHYDLIPLLHSLIDAKNDIVTTRFDYDAVSSIVVNCHVSRVDESLELS